MKKRLFFALGLMAAFLGVRAVAAAADLAALFKERLKCVVAVEFYVETETDRQLNTVMGAVADRDGLIILPASAISPHTPPERLKDFKVYQPGSATAYTADYLGEDSLTGWHFIRVEPKLRAQLTPITAFVRPDAPAPAIAQEVWGIALRGKDEDFAPYFMSSRVALIESLPQKTAIAQAEVAAPGLPVFDDSGALAGLALNSFGQSFLMFSRMSAGGPTPVLLMDVEESSVFQLNQDVLPYLERVPQNVFGRPIPWLGAYQLQPVAPEVAKFLKLDGQSGVVVSEVLEGSPAEQAGLQARDIILAVDGRPLPRLKPDSGVVQYLDRAVQLHRPGDKMTLGVLRDGRRLELTATLTEEPTLIREAPRKYFERLGLTVREFVYGDAVLRRVKLKDSGGVVVSFVKSNSAVSTAGLSAGDWIREIDGHEIKTYAEAVRLLAAIAADKTRTDFVLLTGRGGETAVLRVQLH